MLYYLAAQFTTRTKLLSPYASIRTIIYLEQRDTLTIYRFSRNGYWYIVVIEDRPSATVHRKLLNHMNRGVRMHIDPDSLTALYTKFKQTRQQEER